MIKNVIDSLKEVCRMKMLIVDDEVLAIEGLLENLQAYRCLFETIYTANSMNEGIEVLEMYTVDIIICDIEMPNGSGLELLAWVNEHYPKVLSIVLSCHDEFHYAQRAMRLSCFDYILKPATPDVLYPVMEKALQKLQQQSTNQRMIEIGESYLHKISGGACERTDDMEKVKEYILSHIADEISVESLARKMYCSPDYLTRCFKKKYNKTISEYIMDLRLTLAAELLLKKDLTVTLVAAKVGYPNYTHFTKIFKKKFGMSPVRFRSSHEKD